MTGQTTRPLTRRVDRGRNHTYLLDGKPVTGVTTLLNRGVPKPALPGWAVRETATYAVDHLATIADLDRESAIDLLKGAPWRERDAAARRGTEVHGLAEKLVAGDEVEIPEELTGHVDAYVDFLDRWNPDPVLVEATVVNRRWHYMGTLDLVADIPNLGRCLLDVKTTRSGVYPETALQLAAYRNAETYLLDDATEAPMPQVEFTGVIWVRADGWDLVPADTSPQVFRTFLHAAQVARWLDDTDTVLGASLVPPPLVKETA